MIDYPIFSPDELFDNNSLPGTISNTTRENRKLSIERTEADLVRKNLQHEVMKGKKTVAIAAMINADRAALHRTLAFIEQRWREGGDINQTMKEAELVREREYDNITQDITKMKDFSDDIIEMRSNHTPDDIKRTLVREKKVNDKYAPKVRRPR